MLAVWLHVRMLSLVESFVILCDLSVTSSCEIVQNMQFLLSICQRYSYLLGRNFIVSFIELSDCRKACEPLPPIMSVDPFKNNDYNQTFH